MQEQTVSRSEDVIAASINLFPLMFARTGAPNPMDESCLLKQENKQRIYLLAFVKKEG
jgi:hypothetical protein